MPDMQRSDDKFDVRRTNGEPFHDDEPVFVFRGQDAYMPAVLGYYAALCDKGGSPDDHVERVVLAAAASQEWQREHADLVKVPD